MFAKWLHVHASDAAAMNSSEKALVSPETSTTRVATDALPTSDAKRLVHVFLFIVHVHLLEEDLLQRGDGRAPAADAQPFNVRIHRCEKRLES